MTGIQFVTDEQGKRVAVQIDLAIHGELWEDLQDVLDSCERDSGESVPFTELKAHLVKSGKLNEDVEALDQTERREGHLTTVAPFIARIVKEVEALAEVPPPGCKKLKGGDQEWRVRVGDYRIVYKIDDQEALVDVTQVKHRSGAYD